MNYDVIVCGAGPAGTTTALFLANAGKKVLILEKEKFPRDKVCADNKTWKCLDIVKELGLWKEFTKLPKKEINGVLVASPSGHEMYTPLWEQDVKEKGPWYNVRREVFDNFLAEACKKNKNIELRERCTVTGPALEGKQVTGVWFKNERGLEEVTYASIVVAADGSQSPIANAIGISPQVRGRHALNIRAYYEGVTGASDRCELYYLKGICPGYFWIFPVDNHKCNIGLAMRFEDIEKQGTKLEEKLNEVIQSEKFRDRFKNAKRAGEPKQWGLSVLGKRRKCSGAGFVLVGDAGTFAMTFSGEGVGPSMRSGKIAAQAIVNAFDRNNFSAESLNEYDEMLWKVLEPEVKGFRWLEFLILNETVFDWVVQRASKKKELIELSSRMQNDYSLAQNLVSPRTILKLFF